MHYLASKILPAVLRLGTVALLSGCATPGEGLGYYWQSIRGHLAVMQAARPVEEVIAAPGTEAWLKARLKIALEARAFASKELALPDNGSYTKYTDLKRQWVVWNVFATPELSMQLQTWCYPVVGCASYRGYYAKADAEQYAEVLRARGLEPHVAGIPAYSTLGWFDDPLLSSFIRYPDAEVVRTIFHELGHQVLYIQGDTTFNESFASAIEEIGLERWFASSPAREASRQAYREFGGRKKDFIELLKKYRQALEQGFKEATDEASKRAAKEGVFAALRADYQKLTERWGGFRGYDGWFQPKLTNAHLATVGTYTDMVPGFIKLYEGQGSDMRKFYEAARELSKKPKSERDRVLGLLPGPATPSAQ